MQLHAQKCTEQATDGSKINYVLSFPFSTARSESVLIYGR